jgi:hypothetical protein
MITKGYGSSRIITRGLGARTLHKFYELIRIPLKVVKRVILSLEL